MCFGGSKSAPPAPPPTTTPGVLDVSKATPDPSQAYLFRGGTPEANTTGRSGGTLLLDAATTAPKTTLGGM